MSKHFIVQQMVFQGFTRYVTEAPPSLVIANVSAHAHEKHSNVMTLCMNIIITKFFIILIWTVLNAPEKLVICPTNMLHATWSDKWPSNFEKLFCTLHVQSYNFCSSYILLAFIRQRSFNTESCRLFRHSHVRKYPKSHTQSYIAS